MNSVLYAGRMSTESLSSALPAASVGFIGLGNMGMPMALNFLSAGVGTLRVTGRSHERAKPVLDVGATWVDTPRELADSTAVIVIMVPDMPQVDELLFGSNAISESRNVVTVVVCSSVSPSALREADARLRQLTDNRMSIVDAPVSGGTEGATEATLSIMVGGEDETVARVRPILDTFGTPVHLGPLGSGDVAKACNQLIVAATISAISEASLIAERSGLDLAALLTLLEGGYAGSRVLATKKDLLVSRDYSPTGAAKYMVKDLGFAASAAEATDSATPLLGLLQQTFTGLVDAGLGDLDLAVVHQYLGSQSRS